MKLWRLFKWRKPQTHDFTDRKWGHDYTFTPINEGKMGTMIGWGDGLERGDYLILRNGDGTTRYRIWRVNYYNDPRDMWSATVLFAPRI